MGHATESDRLPLTISKKELRNIFRVHKHGKAGPWRTKFFTDDIIINELKMTVEEFDRLHVFDFVRSQTIIRVFNLRASDFKVGVMSM